MNNRPIALQRIQSLLNTKQPASLGPDLRSSREPATTLERVLAGVFDDTKLQSSTQPLIRSLVLLWHDHLDESHSISQNIHNADGSFLHGIMHRPEPDYGNAKYWFHRVGDHACYPVIAMKVAGALDDATRVDLKSKLIRDGRWNALALVDACESAWRARDQPTIEILQRVQEIECKTLLEYFLRQS